MQNIIALEQEIDNFERDKHSCSGFPLNTSFLSKELRKEINACVINTMKNRLAKYEKLFRNLK